MLVEMTAGGLGRGRVDPLHLVQARQSGFQVSGIDRARFIVMGQMAVRPAVAPGLDGRKGGVGKPRHAGLAPGFGADRSAEGDQGDKGEGHGPRDFWIHDPRMAWA
ncbi:MAG TPA: hypothetical protein VFO18_14365, partial [Methylomirabilota bacterium]|nr:hypothetical protein [Methylomirabilota bacterium]